MFIKPSDFFLRDLPTGFGKEFLRGGPRAPEAPVITSASITPDGGPVGTTFTANVSRTGYPSPTLSYQWKLDTEAIDGATGSTYESAAPGSLTVVVTATNSEGTSDPVESSAVTVIVPALTIVTPATISGTGKIGSEHTAANATWSSTPDERERRWTGDGTPIDGATASTYTPAAADDETDLGCEERARLTGGEWSEWSAASNPQGITFQAAVAKDGPLEWIVTEDTGVHLLDPGDYFEVIPGDPDFEHGTWSLTDGESTFEAGVFEAGVFVSSGGGYVYIDGGTGLPAIDTDASGPVIETPIGVIFTNSGGPGAAEIDVTVELSGALDFTLSTEPAGVGAEWEGTPIPFTLTTVPAGVLIEWSE